MLRKSNSIAELNFITGITLGYPKLANIKPSNGVPGVIRPHPYQMNYQSVFAPILVNLGIPNPYCYHELLRSCHLFVVNPGIAVAATTAASLVTGANRRPLLPSRLLFNVDKAGYIPHPFFCGPRYKATSSDRR